MAYNIKILAILARLKFDWQNIKMYARRYLLHIRRDVTDINIYTILNIYSILIPDLS